MFQKRQSLGSIAAAFALGILLFASCKKEETKKTTTTDDNGYATEHSVAEKSFADAEDIADLAGNSSSSTIGLKETSTCATVTRSTGTFTVDFGTTDCLCSDGRYRRGKIVVTYTGRYADSGSTHSITFVDYYQNYNKITGTKTVTNMGTNGSGQPYFNVTVSGVVRFADATAAHSLTNDSVITSWTRTRTWVAGYATLGVWGDDAYNISGGGTIIRPSGATVNVSIPASTPLHMVAGCRWIQSGIIIYTLPSGLTRTIDYGTTGVCDALATLTLPSGATYTITMP